jgi:hypothetical protein
MVYICMRTRKTPPTHKEIERDMERKGEGPTRFLCRMRATELKIVGERERERDNRSPGEGRSRFMHQRLI